jgi:hypothetical protein
MRLDMRGTLDALAGYGAEAFLKHFYEKLGKSYMEPHEKGLRSLFQSIRDTSGLASFLRRYEDAKLVFSGEKRAAYHPVEKPAETPVSEVDSSKPKG